MRSAPKSPPSAGRTAVLEILKTRGPVTADAAARRLGVTAMAVRQHLQALEAAGEADFMLQAHPRGRPSKLWRATEMADAHFADSHMALATDLIGQVKTVFGEEGLDRLLRLRNTELEKTYRARTDKAATLKARLDALARIRSAEGYMAEVRRDAQSGDWIFTENHCPICAAARLCTGLCREELKLFQRVLGESVKIERISYILDGAGRCAYRVSPVR
jgi:predicted ArsR family transcriptional regulator